MKPKVFFLFVLICLVSFLFLKFIWDIFYSIDPFFIFLKYTYFPHESNPNVAIVLTTSVNNDPERLNIYLDRINKYLTFTNLNYYIVESTGYTFPEIKNDRVKIYSFIGTKTTSSSQMELESINAIIDHFNLYDRDFVLKITGKYFVKNIEFLVNRFMEKEYDFYIQGGLGNHSEIFGSKPEYYKDIQQLTRDKTFEESIPIITKNKKVKAFPKIKLYDFTPRGDGSILEYL